jgi:hypothetical protein
MCLPSRCLETALHATISLIVEQFFVKFDMDMYTQRKLSFFVFGYTENYEAFFM